MSQYLLHFSRLFHLCSFILFRLHFVSSSSRCVCAFRFWLGTLMYSSSSKLVRHCGWPQRDSRIWWQRTTTNIFFMSRSFLMCGHKLCLCASIRRYAGFSSLLFFCFLANVRVALLLHDCFPLSFRLCLTSLSGWCIINSRCQKAWYLSLLLNVCEFGLHSAFAEMKKRWIFILQRAAQRTQRHPQSVCQLNVGNHKGMTV